MDRAQRKQDKAERRDRRRDERLSRGPDDAPSEDPDIAGIIPGPQKRDPELFGVE